MTIQDLLASSEQDGSFPRRLNFSGVRLVHGSHYSAPRYLGCIRANCQFTINVSRRGRDTVRDKKTDSTCQDAEEIQFEIKN
jgi:hypothetical protein